MWSHKTPKIKHRENLFDISLGKDSFLYDTKNTNNKSKNKQVGLY